MQRYYTTDNNRIKKVTESTSDGLPFQVIIEAANNQDLSESVANSIDQDVKPLIDTYAEKLSKSDDPNQTITELNQQICFFLSKYHYSQVSMSIGISYEKNGTLYYAGFSIGEIGLQLQEQNGKMTPLVGGDSALHLFNVPIYSGDRINGIYKNSIICAVFIHHKDLQEQLQNHLFEQEKQRLISQLQGPAKESLQQDGARVVNRIIKIIKEEKSQKPELTRHLAQINRAIKDPRKDNLDLLNGLTEKIKNKAKEKSSLKWEAYGVAMMIFGASLAVFGSLLLLASLSVIPTGILALPGSLGAAAGGATIAVGIHFFSSGLVFFHKGKQKETELKVQQNPIAYLKYGT